MKAPRAKLSPANSVSQAKPSVTSNKFKTNSSSLLRLATRVNHQRMMRCPPVSSRVIKTTALKPAIAKAVIKASGLLPNAGISTSNGTTAKSWNNSTPMTRLPCSDSNSSRSDISLTMMAVLLIAMAPDKVSAVCQLMCHRRGARVAKNSEARVTMTMVNTTCIKPRPNTCLRMARNLGRLNSRPITNIKNTTPNSARCLIPSEFCASAKALGPITTPTSK